MQGAIYLTGHASDYCRTTYGEYDAMFRDLLKSEAVTWTTFNVMIGEFPSDPNQFDVYVVTGSAADAHADEPWLHDLKAALRDVYHSGKRMLGVCFGHQIIANALGGRTERSPNGWEAGTHKVHFTADYYGLPYAVDADESIEILEIHRDHVAEMPPGAELLASNEHSQIQMYRIGEQVLCMQGHPEFFNDVVEELVTSRREKGIIDTETASRMLETLSRKPAREELRTLCTGFLYGKPSP